MPSLLDILRAFGGGAAGGALGWPADTAVNVANLGRAAYGYGGNKLGLLSAEQMPETINPKNVPGTSAHISGLLGVGDSGPEQMAELVGGLLAPGPKGARAPKRMEMTTYHGSPHTFDKFDMSKIGTGEGAQAYGHGLYFAENPGVAQEYQKALSGHEYLVGGKAVGTSGSLKTPEALAASLLDGYGTPAAAKHVIDKWVGDKFWPTSRADAVKAVLDDVAGKGVSKRASGNLYKVDLPDEHIAKMLDWDKPLSQQPESVRKALEKNYPEYFNKGWMDKATGSPTPDAKAYGLSDAALVKNGFVVGSPAEKVTAEQFYRELATRGVGDQAFQKGGHANASRSLLQAGIPGIRYLDGGSRDWRIVPPHESVSGKWIVGKWPGGGKESKHFDNEAAAREYFRQNNTSNFVVFDDTIPKILSRE